VEGGAKILGVFRVINHNFTPKNLIFFPLTSHRGGIRPLEFRIVSTSQLYQFIGQCRSRPTIIEEIHVVCNSNTPQLSENHYQYVQ
jgi:hypothetical protein